MKKSIIVLSLCILVALPALTMTAAAEDTILLPGGEINVRMIVEYDTGVHSWFVITLLNIPNGYHVTNNTEYPGWCAQKDLAMYTGVTHSVQLYSSIGPVPSDFINKPWDKINYILNHKQGNKYNIQNAIWWYTDDEVTSDPIAQAMINAADANGTGYTPQVGDTLAIPIKGIDQIQLSFLELIIPPQSNIQGLVWYDTNKDGIQNGKEKGIRDVTVRLYDNNGDYDEAQTNPDGIYSYVGFNPGVYHLDFILPTGYKFTIKNAGDDDALDSDADVSSGETDVFNLSANETITIWDAGMYEVSGSTTPPEEQPAPNELPTADAKAGEPYGGFVNQSITFNGTNSYDPAPGRIISWRWTFGDGINGTGEITTHIYSAPGNYTVSLLVMDNDFDTDMYTTYALITSGNNLPDTPVIAGPLSGHTATSYQYTVVGIDPNGDNLRYYIDWGDNTNNISEAMGSGLSVELFHQWNAPGFYLVRVYAQDAYNANSTIHQITVAIDVKYIGSLGYFIDVNGDGIYDRFHSNETGVETTVNHQTNGMYLIDTDGDGKWNIEYDPQSGQTQDYHEQPILQYAIIILVVLIIVFLLLYFLIRNRRRSRTISKNQDSEEKYK